MTTWMTSHGGAWLLKATWQASVLVAVVLATQWLLRKQLTPRWRYSLWLLVVVRLALPVSPESGWSVFNVFKRIHPPAAGPVTVVASGPMKTMPTPVRAEPLPSPAPPIQDGAPHWASTPTTKAGPTQAWTSSAPARASSRSAFTTIRALPWTLILLLTWLAGVLALTLHVLHANWNLARKVRGQRPVTDSGMLELLEDCKQLMSVASPIQLLETREVNGPALYGFIRPRLLLPSGLIDRFTRGELRHVFLHELAHVKRHDIAMNWLMTALQVLHWFNPFVWFAFNRMRADRELACDALALQYASDGEARPYGLTIIKLLEGFSRPAALPGLVGILEDRKQMERRIRMIKLFDRRRRWPIVACLLLFGLAIVSLTDARTPAPPKEPHAAQQTAVSAPEENLPRRDLVGQVRGPDGAALANATVFIFSAGPKVGTSPFCPTCYADCRKSAKSDADGNFKVESLDPQLLFRILVVAKNYKPKFVPGMDPGKTNASVQLEALKIEDTPPERRVAGRVLDTKGKPIHGAVVEAFGIHTKGGGGHFGQLSTLDPVSVTDENGEFLITSREDFESMDVNVEARALAKKSFTQLLASGKRNDLTLTEGANIIGRVLLNGKPLPNVAVGVAGADRTAGNFTGNFDVGTDADGRFLLANLPPKAEWYIYGLMDTFKSKGAIATGKVTTGADGETADVGDLVVSPAHRLAGKVALDGGGEIPPKTRLMISREKAWDSSFFDLPPDGSFELTGLPTESYSLNIRVKGYRVSAKNGSLDSLNPFHLTGRVDRDITNLTVLLEPGADLPPHFDQFVSEADRPANRPMRGAENADDHTGQLAMSGRVLDTETGEPVSRFKVTPGISRGALQPASWDPLHALDGNNGTYVLYFDKRAVNPLVKIEAEGYLPASSPVSRGKTNLDFTLKKGTGPRGRALSPDGKPVAGASVVLICADDRQVGFDYEGKLGTWQHGERQASTDADGQFRFRPELEMQAVAVAGPDGFKMVSVADLATDVNVTLDPWGTIKGTLKRPSGPGKAEDLDLQFASANVPGKAQVRLGNHTVTDDSGNFKFDRVPAGKLQVSYRLKMGQGWQNIAMQTFDLKPGENLELNLDAPNRATQQMPLPAPAQPKPARKPGAEYKGVVLLPDGSPASSAQVGLLTTNSFVTLNKARLDGYKAWQDGLIVPAGPDGGFALPMEDGAECIIAVDAKGFAKVTIDAFKASPKITLQPWGRIEGTLRIGKRLGTNELVTLQDPDGQRSVFDFQEYQTRTDSGGKFVFDFVPSGPQAVSRMVPFGNGHMITPRMPVTVQAGGTTQATFGGTGIEVTGRIVVKDPGNKPKWRFGYASIHTSFTLPTGAPDTDEQRKAWQKTFRNFPLIVAADGTFHGDDVAPGRYILTLQLESADDDDRGPGWRGANPLASVEQEVTIPDFADSKGPVDLGSFEPKFKPTAATATAVPKKLPPTVLDDRR